MAVVDIPVDIAVVVVVGPDRAGQSADRRADRGAFDRANTRCDRADGRASGAADRRAFGNARITRARAERYSACKGKG